MHSVMVAGGEQVQFQRFCLQRNIDHSWPNMIGSHEPNDLTNLCEDLRQIVRGEPFWNADPHFLVPEGVVIPKLSTRSWPTE